MTLDIAITDHTEIDNCLKTIDGMATQALNEKKPLFVKVSREPNMTPKQRGSLHVWCKEVAKTLNKAGLPCVQKSLFGDEDIEVDWTMYMVKDLQYKRVLQAMTGKTSTEQQNTVEPSEVASVMVRHYADKGIVLPPWPSVNG